MTHRSTLQQLIDPKIATFIQTSKQPLKPSEQLQLFQGIFLFLNSDYKNSNGYHQSLLKLLTLIGNERVFNALLYFVLETYRTEVSQREKQLFDCLILYIEASGKYQNNIMNAFLTKSMENSSHLEKLIDSCRSSQLRSEKIFKIINEILVQKMSKGVVSQINFTKISLFAIKCIQFCEKIPGSLIQESIRHLLIVDSIQKGQIQKIILESQIILQNLGILGKRQQVSGYWYYLLSKIYGNQANINLHSFGKIRKIAQETFQIIVNKINADQSFSQQIDKIMYSNQNQIGKLNILTQIRGIVYFLCTFAKNLIKKGTINYLTIKIIERLMQIKDFICFQETIKVYVELINQKFISSEIKPIIISSIQQNCLPIYFQSQTRVNQIDMSQCEFYSFRFEDKNQINITLSASKAMDDLISIMMESRGCKQKQKICNCCEQYIHSTIQKQYDHEFNSHQFMGACHLMSRQISRVISINPQKAEIQNLKNYLIDNLKWLLNLNESCSPQHKQCINNKIFDLMIAFPPLLEKNLFLQQVIQDLLASRLPQSINHLSRLLDFYYKYTSQGSIFNETSRKDFIKVGQKIILKCSDEKLNLIDKIKLWSIVVRIWQKDSNALLQLVQKYSLENEHLLAQYIVFKKRNLNLVQHIETRGNTLYQKVHSFHHFYLEEIKFISNFEKVDL